MSKATKPKKLDEVEEAVRARLQVILGVEVVQLDFGAGQSVADLEIRYADRESAPVEVTQALDELELEASQSNGMEPWASRDLAWSWILNSQGVPPNWKKLRAEAEGLLHVLESVGVDDFSPGLTMRYEVRAAASQADPELAVWKALVRFQQLRVQQGHAWQRSGGPQTICPSLGHGGTWGGTADAVAAWVSEFINDDKCADNVRKLDRGGGESHLAVPVNLSGVGFAVWRGLLDENREGLLPSDEPDLPETITDIWLSTAFSRNDVLHFSRSTGWTRHTGLAG